MSYSQTYNSIAELNLEFFWFLQSVIKPDWHGQRSHNGIAAKMLLWFCYTHTKVHEAFPPLKFCSDIDQIPDTDSFLMSQFFPETKKQHQFEFSGFELLFLVSWLSLPSLSLYSVLSSFLFSFYPFPPNLICMLKGVLVCPLWAGFSPGVRPPVQQLGWDFWFDITAFWMVFLFHGVNEL